MKEKEGLLKDFWAETRGGEGEEEVEDEKNEELASSCPQFCADALPARVCGGGERG